jgi:proteasome assembly chaperone (PAC2) family protein
VSLINLRQVTNLAEPSAVVAFDAWVDAGAAATSAIQAMVADDAPTIASFDADLLYDYRARRPTLEISDGRPATLTWPELSLRQVRAGERDLLVLTGPEPDFRWRELGRDLVELARGVGLREWISLGAIPAAVPHTRPVPILGTESSPGLLRGDVVPGPAGLLRVPAAAISVLEVAMAQAGIPAVGYFAQVPHYVSGPYPVAALALLETLGKHLGLPLDSAALRAEAELLRTRLDSATAVDEKTRSYVERLESMVDEERLPAGDELIGEIERFLRERGNEPGHGQVQ